jgi:CRP/FNR family transcriptional regulator, cyclic AMP receptor protein
MTISAARRIRVLEIDPDLGGGLGGPALENARARLVADVERVAVGGWDPDLDFPHPPGALGVLVRSGLLTRHVAVADTTCAELLGPGDLLRPWDDPSSGRPLDARTEWHVLQVAELLVLGRDFAERLATWPEVMTALVTRAVAGAQTSSVALAISCVTGLRIRLLALLWHVAGRFGTVGPEGVAIYLPLTHRIVSQLAGASRPSVSTTLKQLEDDGELSRLPGGGFLLRGQPPEVVRILSEPR